MVKMVEGTGIMVIERMVLGLFGVKEEEEKDEESDGGGGCGMEPAVKWDLAR